MWHVADVDRPDQPDLTESIYGQVIPLSGGSYGWWPTQPRDQRGVDGDGLGCARSCTRDATVDHVRWLLDAVASS